MAFVLQSLDLAILQPMPQTGVVNIRTETVAKETIDQKRARLYKAVDILLPYTMAEFPQMGNRTPGSIVDDVGPIKELEKLSKETVKTLNGIIDSKMMLGETKIEGENFKMTLTGVTQRKLDQTKAKEVLEEVGRLEECMQDIVMEQHRYGKV